ncbi:hypothetical protein Tco_0780668 [Tanacetum coccineum]
MWNLTTTYNVHEDVENVEEIEKMADGNNDESIPEFMDEDDDDDQGFGSGNSTESEGSVFEGEEFQPIKKVTNYYFKEPNDPRETHFEVRQIFMSREQFKNVVNEYSLAIKKDIRYIRNERKAVFVVCVSAKGSKRIALNGLVGDMEEHYAKLWDHKACRGLDGCFLKGLKKGQLLTCVGRDANDQMYPVACV